MAKKNRHQGRRNPVEKAETAPVESPENAGPPPRAPLTPEELQKASRAVWVAVGVSVLLGLGTWVWIVTANAIIWPGH